MSCPIRINDKKNMIRWLRDEDMCNVVCLNNLQKKNQHALYIFLLLIKFLIRSFPYVPKNEKKINQQS